MKNKIMDYCLKKRGAVKEYPFGPEPEVFKVGGKMFAFIYEGAEEACRINLKCDPVIAGNLREQLEAVKPGYHMNKKHWNTVIVDGSLSLTEIYDMIDHSYNLVVGKLPRSQRDLLQEE
ncbi:MmcQ/YjbR family DNA-binding protein [Paenibacillus sp. FSL R7-0345]|uniref:MmcQ/YjbR family DNA-binding protein n=1 Tax=Paenibacillus sp. FSL R7-0345 TaxID=2954535 RepID=UPI00315AAECE